MPEVCLVVISQLDIRYFNYSQMTMAQEDEGNARDFQSAGEFQSQQVPTLSCLKGTERLENLPQATALPRLEHDVTTIESALLTLQN